MLQVWARSAPMNKIDQDDSRHTTVAAYDKKLHFSVPESGHFLFLDQNQGL